MFVPLGWLLMIFGAGLLGVAVYSMFQVRKVTSFDVGSAYWAGLYSLLLLGFVRLSWHGVRKPAAGLAPTVPYDGGPLDAVRALASTLAVLRVGHSSTGPAPIPLPLPVNEGVVVSASTQSQQSK
jgi:hypothetical protein